MRLLSLCALALSLALPATALAQSSNLTAVETSLAPDLIPQYLSEPTPVPIDISLCTPRYVNQLNYQAFYPQNGFEIMDDLHTQTQGTELLCAFEIGFYNLSLSPTDAVVTLYDNDAQDDLPGKVLAGPFHITGLPVGWVRVTYSPYSGVVHPDMWMGVRFSAFRGCGLTVADPVLLGTSHDIAYSPRLGYVNFGGADKGHLPANFVLSVTSSPPVPVQEGTWGALKAIYR